MVPYQRKNLLVYNTLGGISYTIYTRWQNQEKVNFLKASKPCHFSKLEKPTRTLKNLMDFGSFLDRGSLGTVSDDIWKIFSDYQFQSLL